MKDDILSGQWKQLTGQLKKCWSKLTDDDLKQIGGEKDKLIGILQEKYGRTKETIEDELEEFLDKNANTIEQLKAKASQTFNSISEALPSSVSDLKKQTREYAEKVEDYAKESPFKALSAAVGIGFLIGLLIYPRRSCK